MEKHQLVQNVAQIIYPKFDFLHEPHKHEYPKMMKFFFTVACVCLLIAGCSDKSPSDGIATMTEMTADQAKILVLKRNDDSEVTGLSFPNLLNLSPDVATELSNYKGSMSFDRLQGITEQAAAALTGKYRGNLSFKQMTALEVKAAEHLSRAFGLNLTSLQVSEDLAKALTKNEAVLSIGNQSLSKEVARALSKSRGEQLWLVNVTELTLDAAKELANYQGGFLGLPRLSVASDETILALAEKKGQISIMDAKIRMRLAEIRGTP